MNISERIILLIETLKLSPTEFAEKINVQRSGLSHIFSGRNKPSLEFIEKTNQIFPSVNIEWLIFGKGDMFKDTTVTTLPLFPDEKTEYSNSMRIKDSEIISDKKKIQNSEAFIEKVLFFYKDGSFKEYSPKLFAE